MRICPYCNNPLNDSELADLQAENAKLKHELALETFRGAGEIEAYRREASVAVKKAAQAEAENDKLRELARDMWDFFCVVPDDPHVFKEELDFSVEVWKRMRELGVEVE